MEEDKLFLLNRGKLEERLDPFFYKPSFFLSIERLRNRKIVSKVAEFIIHPPEFPRIYSETGLQLIRSQNVRPIGIDLNANPVFFSEQTLKGKRLIKPKKGDVLIVRSGVNAGDIAVVEERLDNCIIGADTLLGRFSNEINPKFVQVFFATNTGKYLLSRYITGATNTHISPHNFNKVSLPVVMPEQQERAIDLFETALANKREKEKQANDLLESINTFLLEELGIKMPEVPSNSIEDRMYFSKREAVSGNRFDPFYHQDYFSQVNEAVKKGKLKWTYLKEVTKNSFIKGYLPNAEEKEGNNRVVQINSINADGSINLGDVLTAKDVYTKHEKLLMEDILIVITGATIGKVGYWQYEGDYFLGGDVIKFQTANEIDPYYVFAYLRCKPAQTDIKRNITGATNGHLSPRDVGRIIIPIPSTSSDYDLIKQISKQVKATRISAFRLLHEAQQDFTEAKKEIENLILQ